jgi:hypothetical protein
LEMSFSAFQVQKSKIEMISILMDFKRLFKKYLNTFFA